MKTSLFFTFTVLFVLAFPNVFKVHAQTKLDSLLPVRGLCVSAPSPEFLDTFIDFIDHELHDMRVNTLVLRVDYRFTYQSYPELQSENPLSIQDVEQLVTACNRNQIRLIPQINLLGHQSWAGHVDKLLENYPQFDETPHVKMPDKYKWPNEDGLYCKSYCPNHPEVHNVVFAVVDELIEAFQADAFHAGMDEVFYLADDKCPRCGGLDPATVFAEEVTRIANHLRSRDVEMWIWGDRLIDGKTTGMGMWEASMNNSARAITMIPKDVVICDWHYEKAWPTAPYFAMHGLNVITCPWRLPDVTLQQLRDMIDYRTNSPALLSERFQGIMQTSWGSAESLVKSYRNNSQRTNRRGGNVQLTFRTLFEAIRELEN